MQLKATASGGDRGNDTAQSPQWPPPKAPDGSFLQELLATAIDRLCCPRCAILQEMVLWIAPAVVSPD